MKIFKIITLLTFSLWILSGCSGNSPSEGSICFTWHKSLPDVESSTTDITTKAMSSADSILSTFTLEQRIGQCFMPAINADSSPRTLRLMKEYVEDSHVGGVVIMNGDESATRSISEIGLKSDIPLFIAIDAEWGLGMRLKNAPIFPRNGRISKNADELILFEYGREIARECRQLGINMVLGPVVDITSGNGGIIGSRSFGNNPERVSDLGIAYAKGLESGGVVSVAKHFPGHGSAQADSHKGIVHVRRSLNELDSLDFKPFRKYIESGLNGIMVGHIDLPAIEGEGLPAPVSPAVLQGLLRNDMKFEGLIITDAFNMGGAKGFEAWRAIQSGADIVLCPNDVDKEIQIVLEKVRQGLLDERVINQRCRNILFVKQLFMIGNNNSFDDNNVMSVEEILEGLTL